MGDEQHCYPALYQIIPAGTFFARALCKDVLGVLPRRYGFAASAKSEQSAVGVLATISYCVAFGWVIWRTLTGMETIGDLMLYLTLFGQSQGAFLAVLAHIGQLHENSLFLTNLQDFLVLRPQMTTPAQPCSVPQNITQGNEFSHVSFHYPNQKQWVLHDINLCIRPGEKVALVGSNGSGKTTLVKLLTLLYDTTEGQILLDGVDLREYDLKELQERIGVIFQDFV